MLCNSGKVETGSDINIESHQQMVMNPARFHALEYAHVIKVSGSNDIGQKGVQSSLGLHWTKNVFSKCEGQKTEALNAVLLANLIDRFSQNKGRFSVLSGELREGDCGLYKPGVSVPKGGGYY